MEVDLKPASYERYTVYLATMFGLQPQSSHWAKVVVITLITYSLYPVGANRRHEHLQFYADKNV